MIMRTGMGGLQAVLVCLLLFTMTGCAWFRYPAPPPAPQPVSAAGEPRAAVLEGKPPPEIQPMGGPRAGRDSSAAGVDLLPAGADSLGAAPDSLAAPAPPETPVDSLAAPPDSSGPAETGTAPPPDALRGPDLWTLDGEDLVSLTGPRGQVIRITRPHITQDDLVIDASHGEYYVDERRAHLTGGVEFRDDETQGTSRAATYERDTRVLVAEGDVVINAPADSLRLNANRARYDRSEGVLHLEGQVRGWRGARRMRSDRADWHREGRDVLLLGSVEVTDSEDETVVSGERLLYDLETDRARVEEKPRLVLSGGEGAIIDINGQRLWMEPNGNAHAAGGVRVVRGGVTALADSAAFFRDTWQALLLGSPTVIERDGTMAGDTLTLNFDENQVLHRADVHGNASVRYEPADSVRLGERSTVRGDSLSMYFVDGETDRVEVFGNATSTYSPASSDSSSGAGTNAAQGDTITIFLEEGEVDRVRITGGAQGVYTFGSGETDSTAASAAPPAPHGPPGTAVNDSAGVAGLPGSAGRAAPPDSAITDSLRRTGDGPSVEAPGREKVVYEADVVEFTLADRVVDLLGHAKVDYGPLTLTAGKVRFHTDRRYLEAEDEPVLVEHGGGAGGDQTVVGKRMDYSLGSREGTISAGRTRAEDGYIYSDRLRRIGDDQFLARQGSYTTCDNIEHDEDPHFHFTSKRMRIYLDDKVVAKPVTLYIRDIPIFALPFYVFSIRKGRQSGFLTPDFDFGLTGSTGRYFRNLGYYWAASEYYDFTVSTEYRERPSRFVASLGTRYKKRYLMEGHLNVSRTLGSDQSQHDIEGAHDMTLGEWSLTGRAEFRDAEFRQQSTLGTDFGYRLDRQLKSDLSLSRRFSGASLFVKASQTKDLATDPTDGIDEVILQETLPSYSISLPSKSLGRLPDKDGKGGRLPFLASTRLSFSSRGSSARTEREKTTILTYEDAPSDTLFGITKERSTTAVHSLNISDSRRIMNALNISPGFHLTENWTDREYSLEDTTKGFRRAAVWSASVATSTSLYGTFGGLGPVTSLRHTFQPSATFSYQPEFNNLSYVDTTGVKRNRFPGVSSYEQQTVSLAIRNGLQAKVRSGEEVRRVDVLNWNLRSGFDFLAKDRGGKGWRDVSSNLDLTRILGVDLSFNSTHDPYHQFRFRNYQARAIFGFNGVLPGYEPEPASDDEALYPEDDEGLSDAASWNRRGADLGGMGLSRGSGAGRGEALTWNAGFSLSQSGTRSGDKLESTALLNGNVSLQLTKNWSIRYEGNWDVTQGELAGEWITLHRDLHCWEASFTRSKLGGDSTFYFRINVKTMPDIKYEQGQNAGSGFGSLTGMLP